MIDIREKGYDFLQKSFHSYEVNSYRGTVSREYEWYDFDGIIVPYSEAFRLDPFDRRVVRKIGLSRSSMENSLTFGMMNSRDVKKCGDVSFMIHYGKDSLMHGYNTRLDVYLAKIKETRYDVTQYSTIRDIAVNLETSHLRHAYVRTDRLYNLLATMDSLSAGIDEDKVIGIFSDLFETSEKVNVIIIPKTT